MEDRQYELRHTCRNLYAVTITSHNMLNKDLYIPDVWETKMQGPYGEESTSLDERLNPFRNKRGLKPGTPSKKLGGPPEKRARVGL